MSAAGTVLDPAGIPVSPAANNQLTPAVAWNGTDFLVVLTDFGSGSRDIYGARVSAAGSVLDPDGHPRLHRGEHPGLAGGGLERHRLPGGVEDLRRAPTPADIYGSRVSATGTVLDPTGIAISTAANYQGTPAVAWNGTDFLVVWQDTRSNPSSYDIYGARVSAAGSVLDPAGIPISTAANNQIAPAVAWNGTDFLVVWEDYRSGIQPRHLRGPGERRGHRARPRRHPHLHRGQRSVRAGGGLERHQLPGGVGGLRSGSFARHLRGPGQRRGQRARPRRASPSPLRPTSRARRRWRRGREASWWCGRTAARAPTTTSTGPA